MIELSIQIDGFKRIDFNKKKVRQTLRGAGRDIQRSARRLLAHQATSEAGDYPGKKTGRLQRSIQYKVSRSGFLVKIAPQKISGMEAFYPAFLFYGVAQQSKQTNHQTPKKNGVWRIAPRANFMQNALTERRSAVRHELRNALRDALVPRK